MAEMRKEGVKDYLSDFPLPALHKLDSTSIRSEIARVSAGHTHSSVENQYLSVTVPATTDPEQLR